MHGDAIAFTNTIQMDLKANPLDFQIIITFLVLIIAIVLLTRKKPSKSSSTKIPPGPWKLPIIGNIHQLAGSSLPHQRLRELALKYGPIMHLQLGELPHIIISSPELAKEVTKTHDICFADRPPILLTSILFDNRDMAFAPYGDYWRQVRKICVLELLSAKQVRSFRSTREKEISNLVKSIASSAGSPINLSSMLLSLTMQITVATAFGNKGNHYKAFIPITDKIVKVASGFCISDFFPSANFLHQLTGIKPKLKKLRKELDSVFMDIINEHKSNKSISGGMTDEKGESLEDLVDVLLKHGEHNDSEFPLSTSNMQSILTDMFTAGIETSSTLMEWTMSEMMRNPTTLQKAQAEVRKAFDGKGPGDETSLQSLEYLNLVIKETLRLHPPLPLLLPRESRETVNINGYEIPPKTKVMINAWAIGRDPHSWNEPEKFYPERFKDSSLDFKGTNCKYIPFGAGRRICPGITYGTAVVELALANLLYHFDWKLAGGKRGEDLDMTEGFGGTARRKHDLYLIPTPYKFVPVN